MAETIQVLRETGTYAQLSSGGSSPPALVANQSGLATDLNQRVDRIGANYYRSLNSEGALTAWSIPVVDSTGNHITDNNDNLEWDNTNTILFSTNFRVSNYIYGGTPGTTDDDTYIYHETNKWSHQVGGVDMLVLDGSAGTTYCEISADQIRWTDGAQDYYWTMGGTAVNLTGQSAGTAMSMRLFTSDQDGTDDCAHYVFGYVSGSDTEYLWGGWDASESYYAVGLGVTAAGTNRDFLVTSDIDTPTYQLMLKSSGGSIGMWEQSPVTALEMTHTAPYITLHNSTEEDGEGGRESRIVARGEQSGGEETVLGQIEFSHRGTGDDQEGKIIISVNEGSNGTSPTAYVTFRYGGDNIIYCHKSLYLPDSVYLYLGDAPDASITHNGSNLLISNSTGNILVDDTVVLADGASLNLQEAVSWLGATAENICLFPDNLAVALDFQENDGNDSFLRFVSTTNAYAVVINDGQVDIDFRVESDINEYAFWVQANPRGNIGINTSDIETWSAFYGCFQMVYDAIGYRTASAEMTLFGNCWYGTDWHFRSAGSAAIVSILGDTPAIRLWVSTATGAEDGNVSWIEALTVSRTTVTIDVPLMIKEAAAAVADAAGDGQVWVKNNAPNELWFTDDTGVDMLISGRTTTLTATGPTDNLDLEGISIVFIDTSSNNVTIGGATGGVNGQIVHFVVIDSTNNTIIEHAEGTGNQDFYLHKGSDETIDAHYGGWVFVCNGTSWYDQSHAAHV